MPTSRAIQGVLDNFVGTYVSRNSDHDGYWLFGGIHDRLDRTEIDLLDANSSNVDASLRAAEKLAVARFNDQMQRAGLPPSSVRVARLELSRSPADVVGFVNGRQSTGHMVLVTASAQTLNGRWFRAYQSVFVAPHDASVEYKRANGA